MTNMPDMTNTMFVLAIVGLGVFIYLVFDIMHNTELTRSHKIGWLIAAFLTPIITVIVYLIAAPKERRQDRE